MTLAAREACKGKPMIRQRRDSRALVFIADDVALDFVNTAYTAEPLPRLWR